MPSRAWVVTKKEYYCNRGIGGFNALSGLSCYDCNGKVVELEAVFQCPLGLELLQADMQQIQSMWVFQCPLGLELLLSRSPWLSITSLFQCPLGLELLRAFTQQALCNPPCFNALSGLSCYATVLNSESLSFSFNALSGLSCYEKFASALDVIHMFQCPLGLELLRQECPIF